MSNTNAKKLLKGYLPYFVLSLAFCSLFCSVSSDSMFITANGSKILEDMSFPHEDWQTMHEGLHVVLQQWLYAVIQTLWYNATGVRGLLLAVIFKFQLFGFVIYLLSDKRDTISSLFAAGLCYFAVITLACTSRPALVTAILLATTALVMKKYGRTHNKVLLLLAPTLSLLQSNIHSTFWMALVAIVVVYAVFEMFPGLGTKNVRFDKKEFSVLLPVVLATIVIGFINPYGYEAIFQPFYTIGQGFYAGISEMNSPGLFQMTVFILLPAFLTIIRSVRARKFVISPELVLYACTIIAALSALRGIVFEAVFFVCYYNTLPAPKPLQLPNFLQKVKKVIKPVYGIAAFYTATIVLSGCFGYNLLTEHISMYENTEPLTVLHDVLDSEDTEGKTVFCDYLTEGETMRLEYGMLPYIDDRLETFNPNINGGNPILDEFALARNNEQDFENLLNKYEFDYIVLRINGESSQIETSDWMSSNSDYELLANTSDYDLASYEIPTSGVDNYKIYVRKTLAN